MEKLHVGLILDGNGRYAQSLGKKRTYGHEVGYKNLLNIAISCKKTNIYYLSCYCFSTENWNRPKEEVEFLMTKPIQFLMEKIDLIIKEDIKILVSGRDTKIPSFFNDSLNKICDKTKECKSLVLNLLIDYSGLYEIEYLVKKVIDDFSNNLIKKENINKDMLYNYLFQPSLPNLDLIIRTGGEMRLSNFMLYQASYAELFFTKKFWPEFTFSDLEEALDDFYKRNRRFGCIEEK